MKYLIFIPLFLIATFTFSQEKFSKSVQFVNDNDLYVSAYRDRYYTNGMFLNYRYLSQNQPENLEKRIIELQIGHEMYTPFKSIVRSKELHDRPFAGHLFGSFGVTKAYKEDKIFKSTVQVGVIGPNAFGYEIQELIHNIYGFENVDGWKYQIQNALSINFNFDYVKGLYTNEANNFDVSWFNQAKIGSVYTNLSSGLYTRIGIKNALAKIINSVAFGTNLNNKNTNYIREVESFFFFKPTVKYAIYDATIGGSFLNNSSEVTREIIPLVFNIEAGFKFTANRFNFGYIFHYHTRKIENLVHTDGNIFGTISLEYLFN